MNTIQSFGYYCAQPKKPFEKKEFTISELLPDQVVVKVAGCGLCHTDISFFTGSVRTKKTLPLVLGHEISGEVVASGSLFEEKIGKNVIVPAVLPCGECELCKSWRENICQKQKMPGNDFDGGFAGHIKVPGRFLCELPTDIGDYQLSDLSIVADAVTTPYQSLKRSMLHKGDLSIVVGVGGIGIYMVQHAKNAGAHVIAIDIDEKRCKLAEEQGADYSICSHEMSAKEVKNHLKELVKDHHLPKLKWKIFETSGSSFGQELAFSLLSYAGVLGVVGFTMDKIAVRLSNIMAFDADVFGNWGCRPQYYLHVVKDVLSQKLNIKDNIKTCSLDTINEVLPQVIEHKIDKRIVFTPWS